MRHPPTWALLVTAFLACSLCAGGGCRTVAPVSDRRIAAPDPAAGLDAGSAYFRAATLMMSGQDRASLPFFRHALKLQGGLWQTHYDYAVALINVAFESAPGRGLPHPAVRTSLERTALVKEAFTHLDLAERLATTGPNRAIVQYARASQLTTWGLRWESLQEFDKMVSNDPARGRADLDRQAAEMMWGTGPPVH